MKRVCFLLLILFFYPGVVNAETQIFNFSLQNNTALNFESGYYIIEIIGINAQVPKYIIVNLTTNDESKTYRLYEGENPYLLKPFDKIDIRATSITETGTTISVITPAEWKIPEKYTVQVKIIEPQIILIKSVDKTNISVGDVAEIKIIIENKGNGTAYGLTLEEELPNGFSRAPGSRFPPLIQDTLEAGKSQELYYALKAVESGTFNIESTTVTYGTKSSKSNVITINVAEALEDKSNLTTSIIMDKYDIITDDSTRADIKIINIGKAPATSILVDGIVPSGLIATEGDLRHVFKRIDPGESEAYSVLLKAVEPGNYSIGLKTFYNDDKEGLVSTSKSIIVKKNEKFYLYIIIPATIILIGIVLFTIRRHKEYSY